MQRPGGDRKPESLEEVKVVLGVRWKLKRREARGEQQLKAWKSSVHIFKFLGIIQQRAAGRF